MYLMLHKQRNRGQDGAGIVSAKPNARPGQKIMECSKSNDSDPIQSVVNDIGQAMSDAMNSIPKSGKNIEAVTHHVPFTGTCVRVTRV